MNTKEDTAHFAAPTNVSFVGRDAIPANITPNHSD